MQIEIGDNATAAVTTTVIASALCAIVLGISYLIYDASVKSKRAIATAQTCEQAVLLENTGTSAEITNRLYGCKLQPQTLKSGQ